MMPSIKGFVILLTIEIQIILALLEATETIEDMDLPVSSITFDFFRVLRSK